MVLDWLLWFLRVDFGGLMIPCWTIKTSNVDSFPIILWYRRLNRHYSDLKTRYTLFTANFPTAYMLTKCRWRYQTVNFTVIIQFCTVWYEIFFAQYRTVVYRWSKINRYGKLLESHGSSDKYPKSFIEYSHHFTQIDFIKISIIYPHTLVLTVLRPSSHSCFSHW